MIRTWAVLLLQKGARKKAFSLGKKEKSTRERERERERGVKERKEGKGREKESENLRVSGDLAEGRNRKLVLHYILYIYKKIYIIHRVTMVQCRLLLW